LLEEKAMKSNEKSINKSVYLPEHFWEILNKHARKTERPRNWLIMKIIDNWISRHKKELRCGGGRV